MDGWRGRAAQIHQRLAELADLVLANRRLDIELAVLYCHGRVAALKNARINHYPVHPVYPVLFASLR
jgi:hypothetical protein